MGMFTVQRVKAGFKFNLKAGNGQIIASSKVYQTLSSAPTLPFPKFEVKHHERGGISFILLDDSGTVLAHGKGYTAKRSCLAGIRSIAENAPDAPVITG